MKKLLGTMWILSIAGIVGMTYYLQTESTHFFGIADNQEQSISFPYSVEIVQIPFVEGEAVHQNESVLSVVRPDLLAELNVIEDKIAALTLSHHTAVNNKQAELKALKAERLAKLVDFDVKITTLNARHQLNAQLMVQISGDKNTRGSSLLGVELKGLKKQKTYENDFLSIRINNIESQLKEENVRLETILAELQNRKVELERQQDDLTSRAIFNGQIGSVYYKAGDQVAAFSPILTIHNSSPHFIKGYIHEDIQNSIDIGQYVWIERGASHVDKSPIVANVVSLGSRIVEYPERLKKNRYVSAWGREVIISLPYNSALKMGEKVKISMLNPELDTPVEKLFLSLLSLVSTDVSAATMADLGQRKRIIYSQLLGVKSKQIEASGIVSNPDGDNFFVVSDENINGDTAILVMGAGGVVKDKIIIPSKMNDIESISVDEGKISLLSSLSFNKKNKRSDARCQFVRVVLSDYKVVSDESIDMCWVLKVLSETSNDRHTRQFLQYLMRGEALEIESHFIKNDVLYMGFKAPFDDRGQTIVIKITQLTALMNGATPEGEIAYQFSLLDPETGSPAKLSDMIYEDNKIILLGVSRNSGEKDSYLWEYDMSSERLALKYAMPKQLAEGITHTLSDKRRMVVFDGRGKTPSFFKYVPLVE